MADVPYTSEGSQQTCAHPNGVDEERSSIEDGKAKARTQAAAVSFDEFSFQNEENESKITFARATNINMTGIAELCHRLNQGENESETFSRIEVLLRAQGLVQTQIKTISGQLLDSKKRQDQLDWDIIDSFLENFAKDIGNGKFEAEPQGYPRSSKYGQEVEHESRTETKGDGSSGYKKQITELESRKEAPITGPEDVTIGDIGFYNGAPAFVTEAFEDGFEISPLRFDEENGMGKQLQSVKARCVYVVVEDETPEFDDEREDDNSSDTSRDMGKPIVFAARGQLGALGTAKRLSDPSGGLCDLHIFRYLLEY